MSLHLARKPTLILPPGRVEGSKGFLELLQFPSRAVYLNPGNLNQLEKLVQLRPHILDVSKGPSSSHIPLTTEQFISVQGEIVVEGRLLPCHLGNERRQKGLHLIFPALVDLEIRMYADDITVIGHTPRFGA